MSGKERKGKAIGGASSTTSSRGTMSIVGDAILAETIKKELHHFRLNEQYMLSPSSIKNLVFTNTPTSLSVDVAALDSDQTGTDAAIQQHFQRSKYCPRSYDATPQTTSGMYGWDTEPLVRVTDSRFCHFKVVTDITKKYGTCVLTGDKANEAQKTGGRSK
ncbi:hypothetical protein BASA50_003415 [Batrachochytrium salamandrivorans]|uniref:Uncharacterized protein n=1 Tax=Batrachochytrium salamandrivorans TaxID=1357716 RepID=A0ABQ8FIM9_9FUNG|nr:hypothetical protein BASA62_003744 [Batrachochytrium salamandrivorans]KAH6581170.1 hypothetical protein BASA60_002553 [Batrachochytrium salamandrivorans]KAH6598909.1 hypothetical protein BASA50_003415 [Batrachochytrium salamandrivorans]KAH6599987.1 hypothetical protein BASA61_002399 [Batrachochytrium salamandrivorans]KAH9273656.1 hypothetical protein BASA83_003988 [Batrachochytrium salamandrivorans]